MNYCVIIPAYNPSNELIELVKTLISCHVSKIIVINDGSQSNSDEIFKSIKNLHEKAIVLHHDINQGKGAALKTGFRYAYTHFNEAIGVVTADADGQHSVEDILRVGQPLLGNSGDLIMGVRQFEVNNANIPFRSQFGNLLTAKLFKLIVGLNISDTQCGLRGIPRDFIPELLQIKNNGYDFELMMLIASKSAHRKIQEIPIKTIYIDNNQSSHFNPILDSFKIYFVLLRFLVLSLRQKIKTIK